jgi:hypothetical protein
MTAPIDLILSLLPKARQRQPGQYSAPCPAHDDKSPSLTIRENTDGAVLLHCFAGCAPGAVVAALGLELSDLFPPRERSGREPKRQPRLLTAGQALELLQAEATFIAVAAANLAHGVLLTPAERERLRQAAARIGWLREESMGAAS